MKNNGGLLLGLRGLLRLETHDRKVVKEAGHVYIILT